MAVRYWDYGAATTVWTTAANWSADTVPVAADEVIFDGRASVAPITGMAVGDTGGVDFDLLHFKSTWVGGVGAVATRLHTSAQKIIIEGSGTYYIEVSESVVSADQTIPLVIINNKDATVYLTSNRNDGSYCCEFTTVIVVAGTVHIGDTNIDTAVNYLYIMPKDNRKADATVTIYEDCIRSKATAYNMSIYMANGTCTTDSAATLIEVMDGTFNYGSDGAAETGMDIAILRLFKGTFYWYPDDSGDDAYIATAWIYGGIFDSSGTTNNDRAKVLGNGAGFDFHIFEGSTFNVSNDMGNITVATNSQIWTIGKPQIITSSYTQLGIDYDQP